MEASIRQTTKGCSAKPGFRCSRMFPKTPAAASIRCGSQGTEAVSKRVRTDTVQSERSFLILSTLLNPLRPDFIRSTIFNIDNRQKFVLSTAMRLVAVTRLRIRAARFVLPFGWYTWRSFRQANNAPGNRGAKVRRAQGFAFWTLTVWENEAAMKDYRIKPPHLQ